jgi:hypothetical protein
MEAHTSRRKAEMLRDVGPKRILALAENDPESAALRAWKTAHTMPDIIVFEAYDSA